MALHQFALFFPLGRTPFVVLITIFLTYNFLQVHQQHWSKVAHLWLGVLRMPPGLWVSRPFWMTIEFSSDRPISTADLSFSRTWTFSTPLFYGHTWKSIGVGETRSFQFGHFYQPRSGWVLWCCSLDLSHSSQLCFFYRLPQVKAG